MTMKSAANKRKLIDTGTEKRFVRRDESEQLEESDDVSGSLSQDVRREANTQVPAEQSVRGAQKNRN